MSERIDDAVEVDSQAVKVPPERLAEMWKIYRCIPFATPDAGLNETAKAMFELLTIVSRTPPQGEQPASAATVTVERKDLSRLIEMAKTSIFRSASDEPMFLRLPQLLGGPSDGE